MYVCHMYEGSMHVTWRHTYMQGGSMYVCHMETCTKVACMSHGDMYEGSMHATWRHVRR